MAEPSKAGDVSRLRVPPHSIEAEESLLGAMLLSEQAISAVTNVVTSDDFYRPAHRHIFDAIQALYGAGQGVDPVTVADELGQADVLDAVGGSGTLITLQARTPAITNALHYAKIVEEKALLRKLIMTANDVAELGYSPLDDIEKTIDSAESMMFAVAQRRNTDSMSPLAPLLDASLEQLEKLFERGDSVTGTPTGYIDLDTQLAGLQPGALIVVGARPAMGKTAFALGLAAHAAVREQRPVLFFSLEMSHLELTQRLIASEARIDATKLRTGRLTDSDWTKITKAMGRLGEGQLWIDDNPALTVTEIRSKARRLQDRLDQPLGLIVVDYLQLMSGRGSAESRQVEVSEISRGLKILARELEVPVMALSQLSRQLEQRADKRPMLADLRESGCLIAETRVLRADTNLEVTLGELLESGASEIPVWSLNDEYKMVPATMTHAFPSGTKEAFRLRLASGREVTATANHPFRTVQGWLRLDELSVGTRIATPRRLGAPEQLLSVPADQLGQFAESSKSAGAVDPAVFTLPDAQLAVVLADLFGSIGSLGLGELRGRPLVRLTATSSSRQLIDDVQLLLLRFGILSRITNIGPNKPRWRLWIHGAEHQHRFLSQIGVSGDRGACTADAIQALSSVTSNPNVDTIPAEVRDLIVEELHRAEMTLRQLAEALGEQYCGGYLLGTESRPRCSSRARLERIAQATDSKALAALAESEVFWDEVVEVTSVGERQVYDATVLGTHNFVANGVIVHNSIEQDADVVMFLYRDEVYNADSGDKDTAEVIVSKHRSGPTGTTRLVFLDYCTLFTNMAREG
ncbi:replicative DNA helicase [Actinobacteria bacterium IMCC26207]|nr:replicative DNA helicase [Actinobacteria bacterium IMCC26207]